MRRGKLSVVGRWGVFVVTALVLVLIPVSVWVAPSIYIRYEESDAKQTVKPWWLNLVDGRFVWYSEAEYWAAIPEIVTHAPVSGVPDPNPGWHIRFGTGVDGFGLWTSHGSWWLPKIYDERPYAYRFDLPLIYPALLTVLMSGILIWNPSRRRNKRLGGCVGCGYSLVGLNGGVCPECGEGGEDMEESKTPPPCHPDPE